MNVWRINAVLCNIFISKTINYLASLENIIVRMNKSNKIADDFSEKI